MKKEDLLLQLAERAYNVEFGACRNFATFDAVDKIPDFITLLSLFVGILGLVIECLTVKWVSAIVLILSVLGLYISRFSDNKDKYANAGDKLTNVYYGLKKLYGEIKDGSDDVSENHLSEFKRLCDEASSLSISHQMYFSDIRANIKFFERDDLGWMNEQLHFTFWKDKVPQSLKHSVIYLLLMTIILICVWYISKICN